MVNKKTDNKDFLTPERKKELSEYLMNRIEENEMQFKKMLEDIDVDLSKINVLDRAKFLIDYIPDVLDVLIEKYGNSNILMEDNEIKEEFLTQVQKSFHKDIVKQEIKEWNIYYILRHCKILDTLKFYHNTTLIPFNGWPCEDYFKMVDKIYYSFGGIPASQLSEDQYDNLKKQYSKNYIKKNPVSLLIINDVNAESEDEVYNKTINKAEDIKLVIGNLINSSIEISGCVIEGKKEGFKQLSPRMSFYHYNPTFMKKSSMEEITNILMEQISKNHLIKLALKYEYEALYDNEPYFALLKRWSALEYIANVYSEKRTNSKMLKKNEIKLIKDYVMNILNNNKKIIPINYENKIINDISQINNKNVKDKIRDLLSWSNYELDYFNENNKDIIDVIYQNRNCITHKGGCYLINEDITCTGPAYCKNSNIELKKINYSLSRMLAAIIGRFVGIKFEYDSEI